MSRPIFIIEDNSFYALLLQKKIEAVVEDANVEIFNNCQDGLNAMYKQPFMVFLDYHLPDGLGIDVLKEIKANHPMIHVIMLSAQDKINVAVDSLKYGATDYLSKNENDSEEKIDQLIKNCYRLSGAFQEKKNGLLKGLLKR